MKAPVTTRTIAPEQPGDTLDQADQTTALFTFLDRRLAEDLDRAERRDDAAAVRYLTQSRDILASMRTDLLDQPRRADEVERYLCRMALGYRDHPDFRGSWFLFA